MSTVSAAPRSTRDRGTRPVPEAPEGSEPRLTGGYDFDLHGLVGIRLLDATPREIRAVTAQLGPIAAPLDREPDIVVRFVDREELLGPAWLLGVDEGAFTAQEYFVLRAKHKSRTRVRFPMEAVGGPCEIVCERGVPAVPLLVPTINMTVLGKSGLPMHAAAFRYEGKGVLVTGWSKGGKTETLLAFVSQGAEYVGDEWVYLVDDGTRMCGIPEPIRLWDWQLDQLPAYRKRVSPATRLRLRAVRAGTRWLGAAVDTARRLDLRGPAPRAARRAAHLLSRQCHVDLPPSELFSGEEGAVNVPLDKVLLVCSCEDSTVGVHPIHSREVADRMPFSHAEECQRLMSHYRKACFGRGAPVNASIERAMDVGRERMRRFLRDRECYLVRHPYPPSIPDLFEAVEPVVTA